MRVADCRKLFLLSFHYSLSSPFFHLLIFASGAIPFLALEFRSAQVCMRDLKNIKGTQKKKKNKSKKKIGTLAQKELKGNGNKAGMEEKKKKK